MSSMEQIGLIVVGVTFFAIVLGARMIAAKIAPAWLVRFLAPPARR